MSVQDLTESFGRLREAIDQMGEAFYQSQLRLAATVLGNAIEAIRNEPSLSNLSDAEFAFADVVSITTEVPAQDEEILTPPVEALRDALQSLKSASSLPPETLAHARDLQGKLRERRAALQRQGYRMEGEDPPHIPHHPRELCLPARRLQRLLGEAGFKFASLDKLVASPDEFALHDLDDLIAELDTPAS